MLPQGWPAGLGPLLAQASWARQARRDPGRQAQAGTARQGPCSACPTRETALRSCRTRLASTPFRPIRPFRVFSRLVGLTGLCVCGMLPVGPWWPWREWTRWSGARPFAEWAERTPRRSRAACREQVGTGRAGVARQRWSQHDTKQRLSLQLHGPARGAWSITWRLECGTGRCGSWPSRRADGCSASCSRCSYLMHPRLWLCLDVFLRWTNRQAFWRLASTLWALLRQLDCKGPVMRPFWALPAASIHRP